MKHLLVVLTFVVVSTALLFVVRPAITHGGSTAASATSHVTGMNLYWLGLYDGYGTPAPPTLAQVTEALDTVVALGGTVIRSHTLGISVGCAACVEPTLGHYQLSALEWNRTVLTQINNRGLQVIIPLLDNWNYYHGGRDTFTNWRGVTRAAFYADERVQNDVLAYITVVITALKDSPAIWSWEIGNELADAPLAWVDKVAQKIHALDPLRPVMSGSVRDVVVPAVDIIDDHEYPVSVTAIQQRYAVVAKAGKRYILGEYAWNAGDSLANVLHALEQLPIAGDLTWSLLPTPAADETTKHTDGYEIYYPGNTATMRQAIALLQQHASKVAASLRG